MTFCSSECSGDPICDHTILARLSNRDAARLGRAWGRQSQKERERLYVLICAIKEWDVAASAGES